MWKNGLYLGSLWRRGVGTLKHIDWLQYTSPYSVTQTLWYTQYGSRPWTQDSPGLHSSLHVTSVLGRSLPLTIRWITATPASPLPQTLKMAAYLVSVVLKTVLASSIRDLTFSVNVQLFIHWSKLTLKAFIYMLRCSPSQC